MKSRLLKFAVSLLLLVGCSPQTPAAPEQGQPAPTLQEKVQSRLAELDARSSFYAKHLPSGREVAIRADEPMNTLSVIKLAILVRAFRDVDEGRLDLEERYQLRPEDYRRGAGVLSTFAPGLMPTYRDLLVQMIILSDNAATDIMIKKVGLDRVNQLLIQEGYTQTRLQTTLADRYRRRWELLNPAHSALTDREVFERGFPDDAEAAARKFHLNSDPEEWLGRTTAREISRLLEQIHRAELASPSSSLEMVNILKKQHSESRLPRRLRYEFDDVSVAHKTGDSPPDVGNDVGILYYPGGPSVISVFVTENRGDFLAAEATMGDLAVEVIRAWGPEPTEN